MGETHDGSTGDEYEQLGLRIRSDLVAGGATPRSLEPLPGQADRAEQALRRILGTPRGAPSDLPGPARPDAPDASDSRAHGTTPPSGRPRRTSLRVGVAVAAAAAVVAVLVVVHPRAIDAPVHATNPPLLSIADARPGTIPARGEPATARLEQLAELAGQQPAPAALPVQHVTVSAWWASTGEESGTASSVLEPVERDSYFQADSTLRAIERRGAPLDGEGRLDTAPPTVTITDESFPSPDPGAGYADRLPTDPGRLAARLGQIHDPTVCGTASGSCLMADVVDLFYNYVPAPGLTAALWRVLAGDDTITYLGRTRDRAGRDADAFTTDGADGVTQRLLLISPSTGSYLGEEVVLTEHSDDFALDPPAVLSFSARTVAERISVEQLPPSVRK